ncbi:uncharacterized protein LOC135122451 isoform X3 [Zophobas morio]|uniref:uncharacterized protein LOC135122451 isoform X3 n=1 Tax=Zophobas morio TaxID=2755281 RepID=UPI0030836E6E
MLLSYNKKRATVNTDPVMHLQQHFLKNSEKVKTERDCPRDRYVPISHGIKPGPAADGQPADGIANSFLSFHSNLWGGESHHKPSTSTFSDQRPFPFSLPPSQQPIYFQPSNLTPIIPYNHSPVFQQNVQNQRNSQFYHQQLPSSCYNYYEKNMKYAEQPHMNKRIPLLPSSTYLGDCQQQGLESYPTWTSNLNIFPHTLKLSENMQGSYLYKGTTQRTRQEQECTVNIRENDIHSQFFKEKKYDPLNNFVGANLLIYSDVRCTEPSFKQVSSDLHTKGINLANYNNVLNANIIQEEEKRKVKGNEFNKELYDYYMEWNDHKCCETSYTIFPSSNEKITKRKYIAGTNKYLRKTDRRSKNRGLAKRRSYEVSFKAEIIHAVDVARENSIKSAVEHVAEKYKLPLINVAKWCQNRKQILSTASNNIHNKKIRHSPSSECDPSFKYNTTELVTERTKNTGSTPYHQDPIILTKKTFSSTPSNDIIFFDLKPGKTKQLPECYHNVHANFDLVGNASLKKSTNSTNDNGKIVVQRLS